MLYSIYKLWWLLEIKRGGIYEVYEKMWDKTKYPKLRSDSERDEKAICFEDDCIEKFKKEPARMKLLIVVNIN